MEKARKIKKISISDSGLATIQDKFGVSKSMVYNALAYRTNSTKAIEIRSYALNEGGAKEIYDYIFEA